MKRFNVLLALSLIFSAMYAEYAFAQNKLSRLRFINNYKTFTLMVEATEKNADISTSVYIKKNDEVVAREIKNGTEFFLDISNAAFVKEDIEAGAMIEIDARIHERVSPEREFLKIPPPGMIVAPRFGKIKFIMMEDTKVKIQKSAEGYFVEFVVGR